MTWTSNKAAGGRGVCLFFRSRTFRGELPAARGVNYIGTSQKYWKLLQLRSLSVLATLGAVITIIRKRVDIKLITQYRVSENAAQCERCRSLVRFYYCIFCVILLSDTRSRRSDGATIVVVQLRHRVVFRFNVFENEFRYQIKIVSPGRSRGGCTDSASARRRPLDGTGWRCASETVDRTEDRKSNTKTT